MSTALEFDSAYLADLAAYRAGLDRALTDPEGWLSLAGLFWLGAGANRVGADPAAAVALPPGAAPAHVADLHLRDGLVLLEPVPGAGLLVDGAEARPGPLRSDADGRPQRVTVGRLLLQLLRRGERLGVRVRDPERPGRAEFAGRRWLPVDPALVVEAEFVAYEPPRTLMIANILGDLEPVASPGFARFSLGGQELRLDAKPGPGGSLVFHFRDRSSGRETYGAGRTLGAAGPRDGRVLLDFNRAYNLPCAFTEFATCPIPPAQNWLPVPIMAGEAAP